MSMYVWQFLDSAPGADHQPGSGFFGRLFRSIGDHWNRLRMIRMLEELDDRILNDIGISRADIVSVVDGFDSRELRMVPVASTLHAHS